MDAIYSNVLEVNPQQLFTIMKEDIYKNYQLIKLLNINKDYFEIRAELINLLHKISKKMGFKSQTFFLSIYYLDIILIEKKTTINNNFYLLGLGCFIVASKYCENDPIVPPLENYIKLYNKYSSNLNINNKIKLGELFEMEVQILKYLDYNLHYVTIYDFDLFFFNHGIIKKQQIKDIINNNVNINNNNKGNKNDLSCSEDDDDVILDSVYIKKILEKIYKKSRFYLDLIIIKEKICFKYNVLLLSIYIMKKSVEEILLNEYKLKNKDYYLNKRQIIKKTNLYYKEVMNNFYNIDYEKDPKYQELIKDKEIKNIFPHPEKAHEFKNKKNKNKTNLTNLDKICSNKKNEKDIKIKKKVTKNNNNNTLNSMSDLTRNPNLEANQPSSNNLNSFVLKGNNFITGNNSKEKYPIQKIKSNNKLLEDYKSNNNKMFYSKTLGNKKFAKNNKISKMKNNSHIDVINNNSNSLEKNKVNCTFTQLKNNLKKNFSLNKKRCKDKYAHINNLKSLCQLSSCSNTIKNIKEGSFINNTLLDDIRSKSPGQQLLTDINNSQNNINPHIKNSCTNLTKILTDSKDKIKKFYNSLNNNINYNEKENEEINNDGNNPHNTTNESFHSNKSKTIKKNEKHKNLISIKYRTNIINDNNDNFGDYSNRKKPYFKKVIQNFEPLRKKVINKDNLKIKINNSLNKSNFNQNTITQTTINKNFNYISLTNNNTNDENENKIDLIKKKIVNIKPKGKLGNSTLYKSNNNIGAIKIKDINNENKNSESNLLNNDINNTLIKNTESNSTNINQNKISKIPRSLKKIPPANPANIIYQNKPNNIIINFRYTINQSPIAFIKEIKEINLNNNDSNKPNDINHTSKKDLVYSLKNFSSTIENNRSYHKKKVFNSMNKKNKTSKIINNYIKNNTINNERNTINTKMIDLMKSEGNSFFKKYNNDLQINIENNNLFTKKKISHPLNSFNTIDSTKNNENIKTIDNEPIKENGNGQKQNDNINYESQTYQKVYSIMPNYA